MISNLSGHELIGQSLLNSKSWWKWIVHIQQRQKNLSFVFSLIDRSLLTVTHSGTDLGISKGGGCKDHVQDAKCADDCGTIVDFVCCNSKELYIERGEACFCFPGDSTVNEIKKAESR